MTVAQLACLAFRQSRFARQRLFLFLSTISLSVAALVAVQGFAANLQGDVREQASAMLGADIELASDEPFGARAQRTLAELGASGAAVARLTSFTSMARDPASGVSRLVQLRAPERGFPFRGTVRTQPEGRWATLHDDRNAIVDPALLIALGVKVGDSIAIGESTFRITATVGRLAGDTEVTSLFAPRIFIPAEYVADTRLLGVGARAEYDAFVQLPDPTLAKAVEQRYRPTWHLESVRSVSADEQQEQLHSAFGNLASYLGLVSVSALLLGGIGVASAMHAYMTREVETVAVLRCLGASSRQVLGVYLLQAAAMSLAGAAVGIVLGAAVQWTLPRLIADLLPVHVRLRLDGAAVATGLVAGTWTAIAFALLPILQVRRVSPLAVLRRRVEALPVPARDPVRVSAWALLQASALALILYEAPGVGVGAAVAAGIAVVLLVLAFSARGAVWLLRRLRHARLPYVFHQGMANLFRPGNQSVTVVLALGFGVFLLMTLVLTQASILRPLRTDTASRANVIVLDVQSDQLEAIPAQLLRHGLKLLQSVPLVPMRIAAVKGEPVGRLLQAQDMGQPATLGADNGSGSGERASEGWITHEYRSTYRATLPDSESLAAGTWWSSDGEHPAAAMHAVSLATDIAALLGVHVGDRIDWDVQGVTVPTIVQSLRTVDLTQLEPHFGAIFEPATLRDAPQTWVLLARGEDDSARAAFQRDLVEHYSNISVIDVTLMQHAFDDVIGRVSFVIRFLASLSLVTGLVVLLGAIATGRLQRLRENMLLKTVGATRGQIGAILFAEYALLGALAAAVGVALACVATWALAHYLFEVQFVAAPLSLTATAAAIALLTALIGLSGSSGAMRGTPLQTLREA
jgi:putative ABC transport system permease protein